MHENAVLFSSRAVRSLTAAAMFPSAWTGNGDHGLATAATRTIGTSISRAIPISLLGIPVAAFALCASVVSAAQPAAEVAPAGDLQRLSRVITVFEIARSHVQQWESNPAARTLVTEMTNDLVSEANLDVSWKARLFLKEEGRTDRNPDEFERTAITKIGEAKDPTKEVWDAERNRVISAVTAHKSCVNCHNVRVGDVMGHMSLVFKSNRPAIGK